MVIISHTKKLLEILSTAIEFIRPYGPIFRDTTQLDTSCPRFSQKYYELLLSLLDHMVLFSETLPNWTRHALASARLDTDVCATLNQRGL